MSISGNRSAFLEWFDVEFHSMVFDPLEDIIEKNHMNNNNTN